MRSTGCALQHQRITLNQCQHKAPTQSACVADCYFIVNVLDLPFAVGTVKGELKFIQNRSKKPLLRQKDDYTPQVR